MTADHDLIFQHETFCLAQNEMLLCIPIPGDDGTAASAHKRRCRYVWYCSADEHTLRQLCTDAHARQQGTSIPPLSIRPEVVGQLRAAANCLFAPVAAYIVVRVQQPLLQALFDLESPGPVFDRVALLRDAAFVARPHVIAGVTKAAPDAQGLAGAVDGEDIEPALGCDERARGAFGAKIVDYARRLGAHLEAGPQE